MEEKEEEKEEENGGGGGENLEFFLPFPCLGEWKVSVTFLEALNTQTFRVSPAPLARQTVNLQKLSICL